MVSFAVAFKLANFAGYAGVAIPPAKSKVFFAKRNGILQS
jgi:hypothetical protein